MPKKSKSGLFFVCFFAPLRFCCWWWWWGQRRETACTWRARLRIMRYTRQRWINWSCCRDLVLLLIILTWTRFIRFWDQFTITHRGIKINNLFHLFQLFRLLDFRQCPKNMGQNYTAVSAKVHSFLFSSSLRNFYARPVEALDGYLIFICLATNTFACAVDSEMMPWIGLIVSNSVDLGGPRIIIVNDWPIDVD